MIAINQFTGIVPKLDATKLPDNAATVAVDCDFTGGRIAGLPLPHDTGPSYPAAASAYAYTDSSETVENMVATSSDESIRVTQ